MSLCVVQTTLCRVTTSLREVQTPLCAVATSLWAEGTRLCAAQTLLCAIKSSYVSYELHYEQVLRYALLMNPIMNMIYPQCTSNSVDILYFSKHEVVVLSDILFIMAASKMSSIPKELNLGQTIFPFENEKITPDIVCKLSSTDLGSLGLSSHRDMNLRMECSKYGV